MGHEACPSVRCVAHEIVPGRELIRQLLVEAEQIAEIRPDGPLIASGRRKPGIAERGIGPQREFLLHIELNVRGTGGLAARQHDIDLAERVSVQPVEIMFELVEIDRLSRPRLDAVFEYLSRKTPVALDLQFSEHEFRHDDLDRTARNILFGNGDIDEVASLAAEKCDYGPRDGVQSAKGQRLAEIGAQPGYERGIVEARHGCDIEPVIFAPALDDVRCPRQETQTPQRLQDNFGVVRRGGGCLCVLGGACDDLAGLGRRSRLLRGDMLIVLREGRRRPDHQQGCASCEQFGTAAAQKEHEVAPGSGEFG